MTSYIMNSTYPPNSIYINIIPPLSYRTAAHTFIQEWVDVSYINCRAAINSPTTDPLHIKQICTPWFVLLASCQLIQQHCCWWEVAPLRFSRSIPIAPVCTTILVLLHEVPRKLKQLIRTSLRVAPAAWNAKLPMHGGSIYVVVPSVDTLAAVTRLHHSMPPHILCRRGILSFAALSLARIGSLITARRKRFWARPCSHHHIIHSASQCPGPKGGCHGTGKDTCVYDEAASLKVGRMKII